MSNDAIMFYQFKDLVEGIVEKHNLACVQVDELYEENRKLKAKIKEVDDRLCELIIDDCGYDPKTESHSDLVDCVETNSKRCEEILIKLRRR